MVVYIAVESVIPVYEGCVSTQGLYGVREHGLVVWVWTDISYILNVLWSSHYT